MSLVEKFINEENLKSNWGERLFNNYPVFYYANDIKEVYKYKSIDKIFVVKPSKIRRFIAILFICIGLYTWLTILLFFVQNMQTPLTLVLFLFSSVWISFFLWTFFLNPKQSYKISIDKDKIELGKQTFEWNRISDFLLMEKGNGKYFETTLVLIIDNNQVLKYNLINLNKTGREIVKRIEFYKKTNKKN